MKELLEQHFALGQIVEVCALQPQPTLEQQSAQHPATPPSTVPGIMLAPCWHPGVPLASLGPSPFDSGSA